VWAGTLWLPASDEPQPEAGSVAFLHTPIGVHLVIVDAVTVDDDGIRIDLSGMMSSDPGMCMGSLEYPIPAG
jgi:hypothetical protein